MIHTERSESHRERSKRRGRHAPLIAACLVLPVLAGVHLSWGVISQRLATDDGKKLVRGKANLHAIDKSGIKGRIEFTDDGTTLTVTGTATGLDPSESYLTLIYDNGSVPSGPKACQPTIFDPFDPDFLLLTMFVGFWTVDDDGRGSLKAINTNAGLDFVPLDRFRNTSIRRVIGPPPKGGSMPMTELEACGRVSAVGPNKAGSP